MPKDGLRQKWEQLRRVPEGARDTAARNLELGDLSVLYAWRVAAESPDLPPAPAAGPGGPGMPGWEQRMRWRLAVGRYMSTSPASRAVLDEAAAAYATALDLAITREHKAMARTGLAEINCARGDYHRALSHLQQAEAVLGADDRRRRIRSRSLAGLGRTDEARRFFGRMAGPSPLPR